MIKQQANLFVEMLKDYFQRFSRKNPEIIWTCKIGLPGFLLAISILYWFVEYPDTGFESRLYLIPLWSDPHAYTVVLTLILFFLAVKRFPNMKQALSFMILFDGLYEFQGPINTYLIYKPLSFFFPVQHPPVDISSIQYYFHLGIETITLLAGIYLFQHYKFQIRRAWLIPIFIIFLGVYNYAQFLSMFHGDYYLFHFENIYYPAWFSEFWYMFIFVSLFYLIIYPHITNVDISKINRTSNSYIINRT